MPLTWHSHLVHFTFVWHEHTATVMRKDMGTLVSVEVWQTMNAQNPTRGKGIDTACTCVVFLSMYSEASPTMTLLLSAWLWTLSCMWHMTSKKAVTTLVTLQNITVCMYMMPQLPTCAD